MDICSNNFRLDSGWQANFLGVLMNIKNARLHIQENSIIYEEVPKPLTRGAINMICLMLIFVLLAAAGTTITVYELLQESCARKSKPYENYSHVSRKNSKDKVARNSPESSSALLNGFKSFLSCFCILKNGKKLLSTSSNKKQFECIHGIRFLSNISIIMYHIHVSYFASVKNIEEIKPWIGRWILQPLMNAQYSVDAFFVISGFLNAYFFFDNYYKSNGNVSWLCFYLKRFIRLTPAYMVLRGFYTFVFPYMGSGPVWPTFDINPVCSRNWLWSLLYIDNFLDHPRQCMDWCWYLANDMQFYIISPIFLISLIRNPILGYVLAGACFVESCLANFILTKQYNLIDGISRLEYYVDDINHFNTRFLTYFEVVYIKPYTRISSYLIGILLAHYVYKRKFNQIKFSKIVLFLGWIAAAILWFIVYFALYKREESTIENAVYNGINRSFYSIGVSWIIFTCLIGQGGLVDRFLSKKIFFPVSKLAYCAYLIHPLVLMKYYQTANDFEDSSVSSVIILVAYVFFWTYVFSFISSLLFEFPVLNLLDLLSTKRKTVKKLV